MPVRGADRFGRFDPEPAPDADFDSAGIAAGTGAMETPSGVGRVGRHPRDLDRPGAPAAAG